MKLKNYFESYLEYIKQNGRTIHTITEHKRFLYGALSHSIAEKQIKNLRIVDVAPILEAGKVHGEYGSQRAVVTFRRLLNYIRDTGIKVPFDWRDIKIPKVPQKPVEFLTEEELEQVKNCFDINTLPGLRTRALIEILYDTGLRIQEAISLNREDIDWEKKEAVVVNCKTKEKGMVYFTDRSLEWLKKYLNARHDNFDPLFAGYMGGRLNKCTARNILRRTTRELGIKKHIRHHIFRRTLATNLIQNQVDIKTVQAILRHKSERTTLRYYIGIDQERVKKEHQRVMGLDKSQG